jgi:hypothetical protein
MDNVLAGQRSWLGVFIEWLERAMYSQGDIMMSII